MPKKLYPQITRYGAAILAKHESEYLSDPIHARGERPFPRGTARRWRKQMGHGTRKGGTLGEPVRNGENHALSIACVVDLLLRIDHDSYVYPAGLTQILRQEYGHLVTWDPYTVGRIFSNLIGNAPLLADTHARPIGSVRWGGARQLVINWDSNKAWKWLGEIRERMGAKALRDAEALRDGKTVTRDENVWNLVDSINWEDL